MPVSALDQSSRPGCDDDVHRGAQACAGDVARQVRRPVRVQFDPVRHEVSAAFADAPAGPASEVIGHLPPLYPEWLGGRAFNEAHGTRFAYVVGEMARGIASTQLVIAAARAGVIGFFGAGGLSVPRVEAALAEIGHALGDAEPWGCNLIHSPNEPDTESALVDLFLRRGVRRVCASAFMALQPTVVRYAYTGLARRADGTVTRANHVFAKISRPEVARQFIAPAPEEMLQALVAAGQLTPEEAVLGAGLPVAEDITVEADSGGHTDNRPLSALFPVIQQLALDLAREHGYARVPRVGAAGGLGTPAAVAAAFQLGAAYVVTGSINQSAVEAGVSAEAKALLAEAGLADCTMAPSADMFELGVKVQVLRKGTFFAQRATKLYELYQTYPTLEDIPAAERGKIEREIFRRPLAEIWTECVTFFTARDPRELVEAERNPRHRLALVFRWYLGSSSHWPIVGDASRRLDYQIWCGPAIGSFNQWVEGSFLAPPAARTVAQIALNLMEGAAVLTRAAQLRSFGVAVPASAYEFRPRPLQLS
ncbi:MAG: PfaD family polyunsaturated fatty acid/polyketide biosynthesis protein [Opitutaceae bacterium]|nr:PfaD family polyunsaturated fatty acid/polyketide biosynthesis protein [Opitutaceae bacterium]